MKNTLNYIWSLGISFCMALFSTGCATSKKAAPESESSQMTLGVVQKRIQIGMSQPDVAQVLGMPNIVTKDARGKETWIYDKIATEIYKVRDQSGVWVLFAGVSKTSESSKTSQKTLTVVIKFNDAGAIDDVTYHATQF